MNPGKVVDPYRSTRTCGSGRPYDPPRPKTHFQFPDDDGELRARDRALRRRRQVPRASEGGTMCPSYMVTHEEKHSTRGRAHLLFEMLRATD